MDTTNSAIQGLAEALVDVASHNGMRGTQAGMLMLQASDMLEELLQVSRLPNLGCATTGDILSELRARIEIDYFVGGGGLDYTTVSGRPEAILDPP